MTRKSEHKQENSKDAMSFIFRAPYKEEIVAMDCNDYCEQLAELAERVASGEKLEDLLPDWEHHMQYWTDCREEFEALVAVLKAEQAGVFDELDFPEDLDDVPENKRNASSDETPS